jgi:excinuclease UvrABC nuclease subunit
MLLARGKVVYVGQSRKPLTRLYSHVSASSRRGKGRSLPKWLAKHAMVFDGVRVVPCKVEELTDLEAKLIHEHRPRYNIRVPTTRITEPIDIRVNGFTLTMNKPRGPEPAPVAFVRRF